MELNLTVAAAEMQAKSVTASGIRQTMELREFVTDDCIRP